MNYNEERTSSDSIVFWGQVAVRLGHLQQGSDYDDCLTSAQTRGRPGVNTAEAS